MNAARKQRLGPEVVDAMEYFRGYAVPKDWRYAFIRKTDAQEKPFVFNNVNALARHIHRRRQGQPIQVVNSLTPFRGEQESRPTVSIFVLQGPARDPRFLGIAWLHGQGSRTLKSALYDADDEAA